MESCWQLLLFPFGMSEKKDILNFFIWYVEDNALIFFSDRKQYILFQIKKLYRYP